jgi:serine/threonine-protein kinase HipA
MPTAAGQPFIFTDLPEATYKRLPAMLSDALPDDFGNALINRYMADQGIAPNNVTALDRLAYMGTRAMGALTFKPSRGGEARPHVDQVGRPGGRGATGGDRNRH